MGHMSRRLHDDHVRQALEDKVLQTRRAMEMEAEKRQSEVAQQKDGTLVNDALRYDSTVSKVADRRRNQDILLQQIADRRDRDQRDRADRNSEIAGYWGPEE